MGCNSTLRALKVIIKKQLTQFVECNLLFPVHLYDYDYANVC